jgi:excinuclease ABC subunit A
VLYVLDEPTIGLHARDNHRLIAAMHRLRDLGNTLLVVEHDREVIAASDYLCDFGPLAGRGGGRVVAQGPPGAVQPRDESVTAGFLDGRQTIPLPKGRREVRLGDANGTATGSSSKSKAGTSVAAMTPALVVYGAKENNLRGVDVTIPLGVLTAITGPSGSGKSSLINGILYPALARRLHSVRAKAGRHDKIDGMRFINKVIRVDQSPLGNLPSSNPATYTGVFEAIRSIFAGVPEAAERGLTARHFSFNVEAGRCEACQGSGQRRIEMHFLPDVWVECEECRGKRYQPEVLEVKFHGKSISDVLETPVGEAVELFSDHPKVVRVLQTICDVGLDYLTLGQSAPTLSGGEAQRIKLAAELGRPDTGQTLYLLDEPTTGLHFNDIIKLLQVMNRLVDLGNSVVVIEHNLDVIKTADWVVDIGPEAGIRGGMVVAQGSPEAVAASGLIAKHAWERRDAGVADSDLPPRSYTGEYLAGLLDPAMLTAQLEGRGIDFDPTSIAPAAVVRSVADAVRRSGPQKTSVVDGTVVNGSGVATAGGEPGKRKGRAKSAADVAAKKAKQAKGADSDADGVQVTTDVVSVTTDVVTEATGGGAAEPWRVLGRKWHSVAKGFGPKVKPAWPVRMAEELLGMLEALAGSDGLVFAAANQVVIPGVGPGEPAPDVPWGVLETKDAEALKLTLTGPAKAISRDVLADLGSGKPTQRKVGNRTSLTLRFTTPDQLRDQKLKGFLKRHWEES